MEDNIVRLTNEYILQSGIEKLPVRFDDLKRLLKKKNCLVLSYGEAHAIIDKLNLRKYTAHNAFLLRVPDTDEKLVLYKDVLSIGARQLAVAHELGHIVLGHAHCFVLEKSYFEDTAQEREAEAFAYQLLAPCCVLKRMGVKSVPDIACNTLLSKDQAGLVYSRLKHSRREPYQEELCAQFHCQGTRWDFAVAAVFFLIVVLFGFGVWYMLESNDKKPNSLYVPVVSDTGTQHRPTQTEAPTTEATSSSVETTAGSQVQEPRTVYVTSGGEKYHADWCQHLYKDGVRKDNIRELSEEQARAQGYTPCSVCGG